MRPVLVVIRDGIQADMALLFSHCERGQSPVQPNCAHEDPVVPAVLGGDPVAFVDRRRRWQSNERRWVPA